MKVKNKHTKRKKKNVKIILFNLLILRYHPIYIFFFIIIKFYERIYILLFYNENFIKIYFYLFSLK